MIPLASQSFLPEIAGFRIDNNFNISFDLIIPKELGIFSIQTYPFVIKQLNLHKRNYFELLSFCNYFSTLLEICNLIVCSLEFELFITKYSASWVLRITDLWSVSQIQVFMNLLQKSRYGSYCDFHSLCPIIYYFCLFYLSIFLFAIVLRISCQILRYNTLDCTVIRIGN